MFAIRITRKVMTYKEPFETEKAKSNNLIEKWVHDMSGQFIEKRKASGSQTYKAVFSPISNQTSVYQNFIEQSVLTY